MAKPYRSDRTSDNSLLFPNGQGLAPTDVLLLFPPITEARLFPYLSLPRLTAYLRQSGLTVEQRDFNIEVALRVFSPAELEAYIGKNQAEKDLKARYRVEMALFLLRHHAELIESLHTKTTKHIDIRAVIRFVRQGIDLLTADSAYMHPSDSIRGLVVQTRLLMSGQELDPTSVILTQLTSDTLVRFRPRVVAISVPFYSQILPSLHLAALVKRECPDCKVILGGPQVMMRHEELARAPGVERFIDALGLGAGEVTLLSMVNALRDGDDLANVPGLRCLHHPWSPGGIATASIALNALPTPDFTSLPLASYLSDEVQLPLTTCVGCYWGRCCFCSYGNRNHRDSTYQEMSPTRIAQMCLDLIDRYGVHRINFVDENTNLKLVLHAVRKINDRGERITFSTRNRLDGVLLRHEFCADLAARGCVLMSSGYETNSQRLLDAMDKGIKASHYQPIFDNLHRVGIDLRLSVMGGILDETPEELETSIAFLRGNQEKIGIDVMQMLVAEPQTYLTDNPEAYGVRLATGEALRGNQLLNFCHGRMGAKVIYPDGDTYESRLNAFLRLFYNVAPLKNDEVFPGTMSSATAASSKAHFPIAPTRDSAARILQLNPWMCILPPVATESRSLLVDLLWQRFYWLPPSLTPARNGRYLQTTKPESAAALERLEAVGAGTICTEGGSDDTAVCI
jgi:radical SAM superfamily enzyme YgiQ (UPF0313 family)